MATDNDEKISGYPLSTAAPSEPTLPKLPLRRFLIDKRIKELVFAARDVLRDELADAENDTIDDDFDLIEAADIAHENETSSVVSEHYCYLRGMADAFDITIVELIDACFEGGGVT